MTEKIDYTTWSTEEIQRQINTLSAASPLTYRRSNHLIELGDGEIRISTLNEDKSWSEWKVVETPNLHVTEGKIIAKDDKIFMIRVSYNESYELCSVDDEPWSDNDAENCGLIHVSSGGLLIAYILSGRTEKAGLITTRTTIPNSHYQGELAARMNLIATNRYRENIEQMYVDADFEYQGNGWIKYFPYEKTDSVWIPKQEINYLYSILDSRSKSEKSVNAVPKEPSKKYDSNVVREKQTAVSQDASSQKNYVVAALLAILLGGLGAHKFYMGKVMTGILYLVFCWTWIPTIIGIIEGLKYLIDGQERFNERLKS